MQRKNSRTITKDKNMMHVPGQFLGPLPFQSQGRKCGKSPIGNELVSLELAKSFFPIFGGTSAETSTDKSSSSDSSTDTKKTSTDSGGSDSGGGDSKVEITPEKFAELQTQIADLVSKNTQLNADLQGYTAKDDEARRAAQGREATLTEDLTKSQKVIDAQDQVIKSLALVNAIQGNKEYRFHDPVDVIRRLDHSAYQFDVDLEGGKATVSGIENELKRIASEADYLLVKPNGETQETKTTRRGTGNPPGPVPTSTSKAARRSELEAKWPVIGLGRAALG